MKNTPQDPGQKPGTANTVEVVLAPERNGWKVRHPKLVVLGLLLIVASIVIVVVLPPVCVLHGCGAGKKHETASSGEEINRLIVAFDEIGKTVKSKVPPWLYEYFEEWSLKAGIQVVSFNDSRVLEEVRGILWTHPDLRVLLRDTPQYRIPQFDPWTLLDPAKWPQSPVTNDTSWSSAASQQQRRRSMQQTSQQDQQQTRTQQLGDELADKQWANILVHAQQAWDISQGAHVVVAVIDTGCDLEHPDLQEHLWVNRREIPGNGIDDDGNGLIDDVHGYDFAGFCANDASTSAGCGSRPDPQDVESHGSHCAGILAAVRNNKVGIAGIAPNASIMCLKVVPNDGSFYTAHIFRALDYAIEMGAHIVSCSFGPRTPILAPTPAMREEMANETALYARLLTRLKEKNMLMVAAAGNENTNLDQLAEVGSVYNPCTLARNFSDNVLCVMATNDKDQRLVDLISSSEQGTNYGSRTVDIGAPGLQILSTVPPLDRTGNASWANKTGSSMATPLVAGIGALVMSVLGGPSGNFYQGKEARTILLESADRLDGLPAISSSRVNAGKAVQQASLKLVGVAELVLQAGFSAEAQSVMCLGFNETYYGGAPEVTASSWDSLTPVEATTRANWQSRFESFKWGGGGGSSNTTLVVRASAHLAKPGLYVMKVNTTAAPADLFISIGQVALQNLTALQLLKSTGGWYAFELRYRNPSAPVVITLAEPDGGGEPALGFLPLFYTATPVPPRSYIYAPNIALSSAFQVLTRPAPSPLTSSSLFPESLHLNQPFNFSAVLPDIAFRAATALRDALYPPAAGAGAGAASDAAGQPAAVVGIAHTRLRTPDTPMRFKVTCAQCALYVNTLRVVDVYDPRGGGGAVTQISTCVTFGNTTSSSSSGAATTIHDLTLRFALANTSVAPLVVTWLTCDSPDNGDTAVPLTTHAVNNLFWRPDSGVAGYVSGMQCDLWPHDDKLLTLPLTAAPLIKFRLPTALVQTRMGTAGSFNDTLYDGPLFTTGCSANETAAPGCSANLALQLRDLFTGGAQMGNNATMSNVDLRCWTYVNGGFRNGTVGTLYPNRNTSAYLGAQTVLMTSLDAPVSYRGASTAANVTLLNGHHQLFVVEWRKHPFDSMLQIFNGTGTAATALFSMDTSRTLLPIPVVSSAPPATTTGATSGHHHRRSLAATTATAAAADDDDDDDNDGDDDATNRQPDLQGLDMIMHRHSADGHTATISPSSTPLAHRRGLLQTNSSDNTTTTIAFTTLAGYYDARALGASAYSQVPPIASLPATVFVPDDRYNARISLLVGTVLYNLTLDATPSASGGSGGAGGGLTTSTCKGTSGLNGNVCGAPAVPAAPRYLRAAGFIRVPAKTGAGMAQWVLRVHEAADQTTAITVGDVTVRNGVEVPSYVADSETVISLPQRGADVYLPALVMARSNRTANQARFEVWLVNATRAETKIGSSVWYGV